MKVLIVVDVQNDFCPGGALAVSDGDKIVPVINSILDKYDMVIFSQDAHPKDHCSFKENGGTWPTHCVVREHGFELHPDLQVQKLIEKDILCYGVSKGYESDKDAYSAFEGDLDLTVVIDKDAEVHICGLALEYCVFETAKSSILKGYKTVVLTDAVKGISEFESSLVIEEMLVNGIDLKVTSEI